MERVEEKFSVVPASTLSDDITAELEEKLSKAYNAFYVNPPFYGPVLG